MDRYIIYHNQPRVITTNSKNQSKTRGFTLFDYRREFYKRAGAVLC